MLKYEKNEKITDKFGLATHNEREVMGPIVHRKQPNSNQHLALRASNKLMPEKTQRTRLTT